MSVGTELRQARETQQLSVADVTAAIKIQPWVLEALEHDRLHEQMSPIYAKGFLSSYARFLHLAPEPLVAQIAWPGATPAEEAAAPEPQQPSAIPSVVTWHWPAIPWATLARLARPAVAAAAVAALMIVNPLRWLPKGSWPAATPARTAAKPSMKKVAKAPAVQDKPAVKMASVAPIAAEVVALPAQPAPAPVVKVEPLVLSVKATRATWIRVRADGKLLTQQRLERGAKEQWVGKKSIEVVIAKPSQVELALNGQSITTAGLQYDGRLSITHQGVARLADDAQ